MRCSSFEMKNTTLRVEVVFCVSMDTKKQTSHAPASSLTLVAYDSVL